jgi:hypothetical protein
MIWSFFAHFWRIFPLRRWPGLESDQGALCVTSMRRRGRVDSFALERIRVSCELELLTVLRRRRNDPSKSDRVERDATRGE